MLGILDDGEGATKFSPLAAVAAGVAGELGTGLLRAGLFLISIYVPRFKTWRRSAYCYPYVVDLVGSVSSINSFICKTPSHSQSK